MPPAVRAAVFEIDAIGHVLDRVVSSEARFHLVRMVGKSDAHERTLPEADRAIRVILMQAKIDMREKELEAALRRQFPVTIDGKALARVELAVPESSASSPASQVNGGPYIDAARGSVP